MTDQVTNLEQLRYSLQLSLDKDKNREDRNRLGQFSTPFHLAQDIFKFAEKLIPQDVPIRFLDPAAGTGVFFSSLHDVFTAGRIEESIGYEIDPDYGIPAAEIWNPLGFKIKISNFTTASPDSKFNLVICNPPYVRHHHIGTDEKARLQQKTAISCGMELSGLAGLYCHFMGLTHRWLAKGAVSGWLIPSEFMDVNYGSAVKNYLLNRVTLLRIHRFDPSDLQFADALVSSAVVWFINEPPPENHLVKFSYGGTVTNPIITRNLSSQELMREGKWTRFPKSEVRSHKVTPILSDYFRIKRGIATGNNSFFILSEDEIKARELPMKAFRPILPGPRYISGGEINSDESGNPCLERKLFLLDLRLSENEIKIQLPSVWKYLEDGKSMGFHKTYICQHRSVWYFQDSRPSPPIVCNYLGRSDTKVGKPFRFILNNSKATIANVYLALYPHPFVEAAFKSDQSLKRTIWTVLNQLTPEQLLGEGRVYGGGLHKLEPSELANVSAEAIASLLPTKKSQESLL